MASILDVFRSGGWNPDRGSFKGDDSMIRMIEAVAQYVFDSDCERDSYQKHVENGNDPREHIYYMAGMILGNERDFLKDIEEYKLSRI